MNKHPQLLRHINKMRGVYASRPRANQELDIREQSRGHRLKVRKCLLEARAELPLSEFEPYFDWYTSYDKGLNLYQQGPKDFDFLNSWIETREIGLFKELDWVSVRLRQDVQALSLFRDMANQIDIAAFSERWDEALSLLNDIVNLFGDSMWSVQLRLALEQKTGGLEAQKKYSEFVKSHSRTSLLGLVAHYTSIRNEERTSLKRFKSFLCAKVKKNYTDELVSYLNYRLFSDWGSAEKELAHVLRVEQVHSIIDVYETYISFCQEVFRRPELQHIRDKVLETLWRLHEVKDFRVCRLLGLGGHAEFLERLPRRDSALGNAAIERAHFKVARILRDDVAHSDPWRILYHGLSLAHLSFKREDRKPSLPILVANVLARGDGCEKDLRELEKRTLNFSMLATMRALYDFVDTIRPSVNAPPFQFYLIGMNSMCLGVEEIGFEVRVDEYLASRNEGSDSVSQFWMLQKQEIEKVTLTSLTAQAFAEALRALRQGDLPGCIAKIGVHYKRKSRNSKLALVLNDSEPLRELCLSLLMYATAGQGNHELLIELIAENISENPSSRALLPIEVALSHVDDKAYKSVAEPLAGLIALHSLWLQTESDKTLSTLRFATDRFLRRAGVLPSELIDQAHNYPPKRLIYFLRYVCVPSIMDTSRLFDSSRAVLKERHEICGVLNILDPACDEEYQAELISIAHHLKVSDGLRFVNRNRVHVDTESLKRWAIRTLSEDFSRYQDLENLSGSVTKSYDETLNDILETKDKFLPFAVPESEADHLLLDIIEKVLEEFLNNSSYGLDYFLSHRVRHQSFISLIRSPLESNNIITTRATEHSGYRSNDVWMKKFHSLSPEIKGRVSKGFSDFAESFDKYMASVKNDLFQIRSAEHPNGLFHVQINQGMFLIARSISKDQESIEGLLYLLNVMFWASLESGLERARKLISETIKIKIDEDISILRETIRSLAEGHSAFSDFNFALAVTSTLLQEALNEAQTWFLAPEVEQAKHRFTLEEGLEIAIESVVNLHRTFTPELELETDGDVELVGPSLIFITDVILVGFSNIKAYSRLDKPKVKVKLTANLDAGTLSVEIINSSSARARSLRQDKKLDDLRTVIKERSFGARARNEGETGFLKLATLVQQSAKGAIEFGYIDDNQFRLFVTFSLFVEQVALEHVA